MFFFQVAYKVYNKYDGSSLSSLALYLVYKVLIQYIECGIDLTPLILKINRFHKE